MLSPDTLMLLFSLFLIEHIIYSFQINVILKYHCRHLNIFLPFSLLVVHGSWESWVYLHLQTSSDPHLPIKSYSISDSSLFNVPFVLHVCASNFTLINVLVTLHLLCDALEATWGQEPYLLCLCFSRTTNMVLVDFWTYAKCFAMLLSFGGFLHSLSTLKSWMI